MRKISRTKIKHYFENLAKDYDSITNTKAFEYYRERRKRHLAEFCRSLKENRIIVDLASGTGSYSESLSAYSHLLNMDLSFNALKVNVVSNDRIARINADALNIPLKNNSVDAILLVGLLHHIPHSMPEVFQEMLRILKSGGCVFIDEPNGYNVMWYIYMKLCEIDKVGARPVLPHLLRRLANRHCWRIEKELYWGFIPPWPKKRFTSNIFTKMESFMESSFLSCLCVRYSVILRKRGWPKNESTSKNE